MSSNTPLTEPDYRYRVGVLLQRSERPSLWTFHCPRCTMAVCELMNTEITTLTDIIDFESGIGNGYKCKGRYENGHCGIWYYFVLRSS